MRPSLPSNSQHLQISRTSPRIFSMMLSVGKRTSIAAVARGDGSDRAAALHKADIDCRTEVVIGQPMQPLDLARERFDRTNALRMSSAGMGSQPGDLQFDKGRPFPPRHQIAAGATGLRIEDGTRVFGFGIDDRTRGRRSNFLIRGI